MGRKKKKEKKGGRYGIGEGKDAHEVPSPHR